MFKRALRRGGPWSDERLDALWEQFDQGTQRAVLRLHRDTPVERLAEAGRHLDLLRGPALVIWGERDPWLAPALADSYAASLPGAALERIPEAGHWPWLDQPGVIDRVAAFLH
jgi:pimeloyl-ACP methyl ester carboxylesterase